MLSKISIGVAPNKTACIKVEERQSDDVRDDLVQMMREELEHRSLTFQVCEMNQTPHGDKTYLLLPVKDELQYMHHRCMVISGGISAICEQTEKIDDFFKWMDRFMNPNTPSSPDQVVITIEMEEVERDRFAYKHFATMCEQSLPEDKREAMAEVLCSLQHNRPSLYIEKSI